MKRLVYSLCAAVVLGGCAVLGGPTPETFNQKLAVGYSTVTAVRSTATQLLIAKKIGSGDAQNVQKQADAAREGLDVAREMSKVDFKAADVKLSTVTSTLQVLQRYLVSKQ